MTRQDFGAFDALHPPDRALLDDCVHCGFCLPACPTYQLWGEEPDSPRGRLYLMSSALDSEIGLDRTFVRHLDACLGCMGCMTACPSGVRYDRLVEATRAQIERNAPRTLGDRAFRKLLFALFPHPRRLRVAALLAWLYQRSGLQALARRSGLVARLPARLGALEALLPPVELASTWRRLPRSTPPPGRARLRVGLVTGCVQSVFFSRVNEAAAAVLAAEGCEVVAPPGQGCCGALGLHSGLRERAAADARKLIAVMEGAAVDAVVVTAAGCGSALKGYGELLGDDAAWAGRARTFAASVRDVTELLAGLEPRATRHEFRARIAYHDACHLAHAQGVRAEPRALLRSIPGVELVDVAEAELCCGSAGVYNLLEPDAAAELGRRKAEHLRAAGADVVVSANPGCLLQFRRHLGDGVPLLHPVEVLARSVLGRR
jgi:glycolate oxidase iron-sulfur subunit